MPFRLLLTSLALLSILLADHQVLATFDGIVHGVSKKQITIENPDGNLVDFEINGKTRILRAKKRISADDLKTGDSVTIEAKQEMEIYLVAVTITVH
jgi:hypothetical protein